MKYPKYNIFSKVLVLIIMVSAVSCKSDVAPKGNNIEHRSELIPATEVNSLLQEGSSAIFVDVRTPKEISKGKIAGALEVNFRDVNFKENISKLDKSKEYVIYCKSGGRSASACQVMKDLGFTRIKDLDGGYTAYKATIN